MEKGKQPLGKGTVINGNKCHDDPHQDNQKNERIFKDSGNRQTVDDDSQNDTTGQLEELLEGHVSYQTEFV